MNSFLLNGCPLEIKDCWRLCSQQDLYPSNEQIRDGSSHWYHMDLGVEKTWVFREIWSLAFGLQWLVAHNLTSWYKNFLAMFNLNLHHALCGWDLNVWSRHISFNHIWEQNCRNIYKWSSAITFATARKVLDLLHTFPNNALCKCQKKDFTV